jgi:serine/threonine protein kinase/predicted Zn-dependent protease
MKCPNCNADISEDSHFCSKCGAPLKPSEEVSVTKTLQKPAKGFKKDTVIAKKYKIIEKLGEGGMGIVYKARDTRLDRTVALKFLPPDLTSYKEAKGRFIQEAKAAAALNHPHICTIYEIDEADNQTFISMEYIKGQSLKDKLKEGPLSIDEAKDIALQVAAGLDKAHKKGIVHRDIKPANIMINDEGQAKITDFGLAKLSWGADLTKPSTIMGTVAYMSPEQARGEEVDHRTDIWSLGAMLYEMLSGERPFQKAQDQALIYAILNDKPTPISLIRSDIPDHAEHLIERALVKKADERYQNVDDLINDLKEAPSIMFPKAEKSIVVLPFDDLSPERDQEYFSDGLTEEVISDLSGIGALRVISRSSAMTFKGTKKTAPAIAKQLNVQYVLEGSVRKAGNNLRITAQLIDATQDAHLWSEKYNGTLDDVFDIQESVSSSIVGALRVKLKPDEMKEIVEHPIENIHAYESYLRARKEFWSFSKDSLDRALHEIKRAIDLVGENELLLATEGAIFVQNILSGIKKEKFLRKLEECVQKIFQLNPESYQGNYLEGIYQIRKGQIQEAVFNFKRVLSAYPNNPDALFWLTYVYCLAGKTASAKPLSQKLLKIDPLTPLNYMMPGYIAEVEGRFDDAIEYKHKALVMEPKNPFLRYCYIQPLLYSGRHEEGFLLIERLLEDTPFVPWAGLCLLYKNALTDEKEEALSVISREQEEYFKSDEAFAYALAEGYALINEKKKALDWLENAINRGFINYPFLNKHDPFLENIHGEERFKKLMERVKHEWENFQV